MMFTFTYCNSSLSDEYSCVILKKLHLHEIMLQSEINFYMQKSYAFSPMGPRVKFVTGPTNPIQGPACNTYEYQ